MADAVALARVYAAAEGATRLLLGAGPVEAVDLAAWFAERLGPQRSAIERCFIAEIEGGAVGLAELEAPAQLSSIYVVPESWGTGVGDALHRRALEHLRSLGVPRAWLSVFARNKRARRFYERNGWIEVGQDTAEELDGVLFEMVRYERSTTPPSYIGA